MRLPFVFGAPNQSFPPRTPPLYKGRFAPSPSGKLHFGSLVAAVGSYLQAKANQGLWLVRIEDIDPPREVKGAADDILKTLEIYGLHWDQSVVYQSAQSDHYRATLDWLTENDLAYLCQCTRKQINQNSPRLGIYARTCRDLSLEPNQDNCSIRFKNDNPILQFEDPLQGVVSAATPTGSPSGFADDFIIHRKDGLFAYQLAVVVDDIMQGITEVVRGSDLLSTTLHQMTLYQAFGQPLINYLHLPVAVTEPGKKLSKQNHAKPVDLANRQQTLVDVLVFLGMDGAEIVKHESVEEILRWAVERWTVDELPKRLEVGLR
ncbi:MAG: tRNA glutamyl-Q(34) synthetase GluQRS [Algicola sp.]|nr:tRNA glutamyl-Q(34) synthetase GluQRS [Algicola sp.]